MNFLAHFHLAWPDAELVLGGLEGDYHKGPVNQQLPKGFRAGIELHRAIDAFTDSHPQIEALRVEFPSPLRRYAGILIDLSFDHYLTLHWQRYSDITLDDFNHQVYRLLQQQQALLSPAAQRMAERIREHDVLGIYRRWETVPASAARVGERLRRGNPLRETHAAMEQLRPTLEQAFLDFYPDLLGFSRRQQELNHD